MTAALTPDEIRARAEQYLTGLGTTGEEVAASLVAAGITGNRARCGSCPIANALLEALNGLVVRVAVRTFIELTLPSARGIVLPPPPPVTAFIEQFDEGRHPELYAAAVVWS